MATNPAIRDPQRASLVAHFGRDWKDAEVEPRSRQRDLKKAIIHQAVTWAISKYGSQNTWQDLAEDYPEPAVLGVDRDGPWQGTEEEWDRRVGRMREVRSIRVQSYAS